MIPARVGVSLPGMTIHLLIRKLSRTLTTIIAVVAAPLLADKLVFDHRLVPALQTVLDSGDPAMTAYDGRNPANLIDVIAVRGQSAKDWEEAVVIIARRADTAIATPEGWLAQLQRDAARQCPATFTVLVRDPAALTIERRSTGCRAGYPPVALYRIVQGQPSLFMIAALSKSDFTAQRRAEYLAMMGSARIE